MARVVVIPARLDSRRIPGKALAEIAGVPLVVRVWERACAVPGVSRVLVATDDPGIAGAVRAAGGEVRVTGPADNGSARVAAAVRDLPVAHVVNVQGDQPELDPAHVSAVFTALEAGAPLATLAVPLDGDPGDPALVKVVFTPDGRALSFSRAPIPFGGPFWRHVGIYGFRAGTLAALQQLGPSAWERAEDLEQLRWLEAGYPMHVVRSERAALPVDTLAQLDALRARWPRP